MYKTSWSLYDLTIWLKPALTASLSAIFSLLWMSREYLLVSSLALVNLNRSIGHKSKYIWSRSSNLDSATLKDINVVKTTGTKWTENPFASCCRADIIRSDTLSTVNTTLWVNIDGNAFELSILLRPVNSNIIRRTINGVYLALSILVTKAPYDDLSRKRIPARTKSIADQFSPSDHDRSLLFTSFSASVRTCDLLSLGSSNCALNTSSKPCAITSCSYWYIYNTNMNKIN